MSQPFHVHIFLHFFLPNMQDDFYTSFERCLIGFAEIDFKYILYI